MRAHWFTTSENVSVYCRRRCEIAPIYAALPRWVWIKQRTGEVMLLFTIFNKRCQRRKLSCWLPGGLYKPCSAADCNTSSFVPDFLFSECLFRPFYRSVIQKQSNITNEWHHSSVKWFNFQRNFVRTGPQDAKKNAVPGNAVSSKSRSESCSEETGSGVCDSNQQPHQAFIAGKFGCPILLKK